MIQSWSKVVGKVAGISSLHTYFDFSNYWLKYLGNTMLLWPPSPIFNVGVLQVRKVTIFFPWKIQHWKGEGGICKMKLPSQHFCPWLSEKNCKQFLAYYNTKFTEDMQLLFSIITVPWIIFIVVVFGHHSQNMEFAKATYVLTPRNGLPWHNIALQQYLRTGTTVRIESPFSVKLPFCFMKFTS